MGEWVRNVALGGALIVGLGVIGAVSGFSLGADLQEYDERRTFAAQDLSKIWIETGDVDVNLLPGQTNEAVVHLHGAGDEGKYHLTADQRGDQLHVKVDHDPIYFSLNLSAVRKSIRLDVTVPQKQYEELKAELSSGDFAAEDLKAKNMEVTASSGDLLLRHITAQTGAINVTSGDIRVDTWQGAETFSSTASSGDLVLNDVSGAVRAEASSGDITLRLKGMNGDVEVHASSGDTVVSLPGSASFEFALTTSSGDVAMDFPATFQNNDEDRKSGTVGSGGKKLVIETSSGEIGVRKN